MPLADKLIDLSGDYSRFVNKNNDAYFTAYIEQLERWKNSSHSHPSVRAVYDYLSQKTLMQDLIDCHVLQVNAETRMLEEKANIAGIAQQDAFVRFRVHRRRSPTGSVD